MQYITPAMTQIFDDYYHDWTAPKDQEQYKHEHVLYSLYRQSTVDYIFQHHDDLYSLIDSLIINLKTKYIPYYGNFLHKPTIFDNLQQISHQLIDHFDQPIFQTTLCAFLQLFNQDDAPHMRTLINHQIHKGLNLSKNINNDMYITHPSLHTNPSFIELSCQYINQQQNHWHSNCRVNRILNFFYEIIGEQLKPIFDNYHYVEINQFIPKQLPNIVCNDNLPPNRINISNYPFMTSTYKWLPLQYHQYDDFKVIFNIYTINQIIYILNLDCNLINMFAQWSNYLNN